MQSRTPEGGSPREGGGASSAPSDATADPHNGAAPDETASQAFKAAAARVAEIAEYASYYIATRADALKVGLRNKLMLLCMAIMGMLVGATVVVVAVVFLLAGLANGIGVALGNRIWLGDLIVGVFVLAVIPLVAKIGISKLIGLSRKYTVNKYESRKHSQRSRFGQDVEQRAEHSGR